jgi:signal transduction histidine kinase
MNRVNLIYLILLFCAHLGLSGCISDKNPCQIRPEIQYVFHKADSLIHLNEEHLVPEFLRNTFKIFPNLTAGEINKKYEYLLTHYFLTGDNDSLKVVYADSLEQSLKNNPGCTIGFASLQFYKSNMALKNNQSLLMLELYDHGMTQMRKMNNPCDVKIQQSPLIYFFFRQKNYEEAIRHLQDEIDLIKNCPFNDIRLRFSYFQGLINDLGVAYERLDMLDSAEYYYHKALDFIEKNRELYPNHTPFINLATGVILGNLGGIYFKKGQYNLSEEYLNKAIELNENSDIHDVTLSKIKLLHTLRAIGNIEEATDLEDETLHNLKELPDFHLGHQRFAQYAHQKYLNTGAFDKAYHWLEKLREIESKIEAEDRLIVNRDIFKEMDWLQSETQLQILEKDNYYKTLWLWLSIVAGASFSLFLILLWRKNIQRNHLIDKLTHLNIENTEKNKQLFVNMQALQDSQEQNKKMMRILAHDLRTPVSSVINLADLILTVELDKKERDEMAFQLKKSGTRVLEIINDQLASEAKNQEKPKMETNIIDLLQSCIEALSTSAATKNIKITSELKPFKIPLHREKMWRVFSNLITNAIKFSPEGTEIHIFSEELEEGNTIRICIKDQGIGISPEAMKTLFDANKLYNRAGTKNEPSYGMGLSICKQIIEEHHGRIWCESEPGKGSTFYIELKQMQP